MSKLKYLVGVIIVVDLVLIFPVMFSWEAIGRFLKVAAFPEVFTTLVVEITLLILTSLVAYLVSRILKGTALQKAYRIFLEILDNLHKQDQNLQTKL